MLDQDKQELRIQVRQVVSLLTKEEIDVQSNQVCDVLEGHPLFVKAQNVLLYWSMPREVQTHHFIEKWVHEKAIYLPVIQQNQLIVVKYSGVGQMVKNPQYNFWEPIGNAETNMDKIDLVIVPALAFDFNGNRLGKGGGFYDRLLPQLPLVKKIGLALKQQMVIQVPMDSHDVKMDLVICIK